MGAACRRCDSEESGEGLKTDTQSMMTSDFISHDYGLKPLSKHKVGGSKSFRLAEDMEMPRLARARGGHGDPSPYPHTRPMHLFLWLFLSAILDHKVVTGSKALSWAL